MLELDFGLETPQSEVGFVYGMKQDEYRAVEALCSSDLKKLYDSPFEYFRGVKSEPTPAMIEGTLIHCLICEPHLFNQDFAVFDSYRKPAVCDENGRLFIKNEIYENLLACAEYVRASLLKYEGIDLEAMDSEVSYFGEWRGRKVKARADKLTKDKRGCFDIKKTKSAKSDDFTKQVCNLNYAIQYVFYKEVLGLDEFYWLAVETTPIVDGSGVSHYRYNLFKASQELEDKGKRMIDIALNVLEHREIFDRPMHPSEFVCDDLEGFQLVKMIRPPLWYVGN